MNVVRAIIETTCDTEGITLSGRLLRRLGNASLGFPDGKPYWFLHLREPDEDGEYDIDEFDSCELALKGRDALKTRKKDPELYVISGPFVSTEDDVAFLPKASERKAFREAAVASGRVDTPLKSVILVFKDASRPNVELDATEYDALFWGRSSVHKFAVPYYVGAIGLKYGVRVHDKFRGKKFCDADAAAEPPAYALVHEPDTEYALQLNPAGGGIPELI